MRRTATLSIFAEEEKNYLANIDNLFSLNKKCKLELGILNTVPNYVYQIQDNQAQNNFISINYKQEYGQIVWFPLGLYIMFNPSISHSTTGVTISLQLKDKMCLLNGDVAGQIHSSVDFSVKDQIYDPITGESIDTQFVLMYDIILQLVNHWGNEALSKIIISQVPLQIKNVVKWSPTEDSVNYNKNIFLVKTKEDFQLTVDQPSASDYYFIRQYAPGEDIGYIYTDFVYPGGKDNPLSCNAGETVTSVLDKIIQVLGNYEYFYDVQGNFIFREKQNFLNMSYVAYWTKENSNTADLPVELYDAENYKMSKSVYNFSDNKYTTAFNNTLNFNNIKNDFVVWGTRKSSVNSSSGYPCRFHLAIDKKPNMDEIKPHRIALYNDGFNVIRARGFTEVQRKELEQNENYTLTYRLATDWRQEIYYQMLEDQLLGTGENTQINNSYFQYYAELKEQFPKIFDLSIGEQYQEENGRVCSIAKGWTEQMKNTPWTIGYYLDFIDEDTGLGQYSVNNIGRRSYIEGAGNTGINCVFQPTIQDLVFIDQSNSLNVDINNLIQYGQRYIWVSDEIYNDFDTGGILNSCYQEIKNLLYQYTHENNTISITTLPIFYLQPNTRITVENESGGISGDYIIQSISVPLDINSTMNINAYKALQKI